MNSEMKILIGYDGSECADSALDNLQRAGLPREAEVKVLTVTELWLPPPSYALIEPASAGERTADLAAARMLALAACKKIEAAFPNWKATALARVGSPAREILETADEWKPDLIVVGSHGRSALGRIIFGSVSQKIVAEAHCSVRVARSTGEKENDAPARIIIGVDGSPESQAAITAAASRFWPKGSEVKLVTSVGFPATPAYPHAMLHRVKLEEKQAENYLKTIRQTLHDAIEAELRAAGLEVSSLVKEGDPKRVIVEETERWNADAVFVGSRGLGQLKRFLLGSVSAAIVSRANCSVEVIRIKENVHP